MRILPGASCSGRTVDRRLVVTQGVNTPLAAMTLRANRWSIDLPNESDQPIDLVDFDTPPFLPAIDGGSSGFAARFHFAPSRRKS